MSAGNTRLRIGVLGAGMIATVAYGYLPGLRKIADRVEVVAISSRTRARAEKVAEDWNIPAVYDDLDTMLADTDLDAVLNLTPIDAHFETSMRILAAGKHLVTEKPIATSVSEADKMAKTAASKKLLVVCAPMEMLRPEWIEARRLVREGVIGKVAFARVESSHAGPAAMAWPVDPSWFYQAGAGPLFDLGVYGLDRITGILGPAQRVMAFSGVTAPVRHARGGPFDGLAIPVTEPDNTVLMLDFGQARFAMVDATFNVVASKSPQLELFGQSGTILVNRPDATAVQGQLPIELYRVDAAAGMSGWVTPQSVGNRPIVDRPADLERAVLLEHLADCLDSGQAPVVGLDRARHVLEIMVAAQTSAREGHTVELSTTFAP